MNILKTKDISVINMIFYIYISNRLCRKRSRLCVAFVSYTWITGNGLEMNSSNAKETN